MEFKGNKMRLVKLRDYKTKNDRMMYFATVADIATYENNDFVLDSEYCNPADLHVGQDYATTLIVDGKYSKIQLSVK